MTLSEHVLVKIFDSLLEEMLAVYRVMMDKNLDNK